MADVEWDHDYKVIENLLVLSEIFIRNERDCKNYLMNYFKLNLP